MNSVIQLDCEYTRENLMEVQKPLHKKSARLCTVFAVIGAAAAVISAALTVAGVDGFAFTAILSVIWGVFFLTNINKAANKSVNTTVKNNQKNYGETVKTTLKFYNSMIMAQNHQSGSEKKLGYDDIARILRTKNMLLLVTADKSAVMGDIRTVEPEVFAELWSHLMSQCPGKDIEICEK